MAEKSCADADFVRLYETKGPWATSRQLGVTTRGVYKRRSSLEKLLRRQITPPAHNNNTRHNVAHPQRVQFELDNGVVLVGSDAHIWPGPMSTAMRAFIKFCKDVKPKAVILNGDVMDFPQISRHPPIGWEAHPTVEQEIRAAQETLCKIEDAAGRARKVWTLGNHDGRFETRLATVAPEFAKIHGIHLRDHFSLWDAGWSCWVNDVVIKHRLTGGVNATRNNVLRSGHHTITGHLHSANVRGFTDYRGTRWGVDTGCLADPDHSAFVDYTEDGPKDWRSAFCLLTFYKGQLLPPELVLVHDSRHVAFRGKLHRV